VILSQIMAEVNRKELDEMVSLAAVDLAQSENDIVEQMMK